MPPIRPFWPLTFGRRQKPSDPQIPSSSKASTQHPLSGRPVSTRGLHKRLNTATRNWAKPTTTQERLVDFQPAALSDLGIKVGDPEFQNVLTAMVLSSDNVAYIDSESAMNKLMQPLDRYIAEWSESSIAKNIDQSVLASLELDDGNVMLDDFKRALTQTATTLGRREIESKLGDYLNHAFLIRFDDHMSPRRASVKCRDPSGQIKSFIYRDVEYFAAGTIGKGNAGTADQFKSADGRSLVVKTPAPSRPERLFDRKAMRSEPLAEARAATAAMGAAGDQFVTPLLAVLRDQTIVRLVMPHAEFGDVANANQLLSKARGSPRDLALCSLTLAGDVLAAASWIQRQGLWHRDLKLENVLLDGDGRCRIADLGVAMLHKVGSPLRGAVTPIVRADMALYTPPEIFLSFGYVSGHASRHYHSVDTQKADSWQVGAMLLNLLRPLPPSNLPFPIGLDADAKMSFDPKSAIAPFSAADLPGLDPQQRTALHDLLVGLLQPHPSKRLSLDEAMERLPFDLDHVGTSETRERMVKILRAAASDGSDRPAPTSAGPATEAHLHRG